MLKNDEDVINLIQSDEKMMKIIKIASTLNLPDWWICAGFVRSKIWDTLHSFNERTETPDVDVIYFDDKNIDENFEKELEKKLIKLMPNIPWSVKNEARMHIINNLPSYTSSEDAISKFPETATALGVTLDKENNLILTAPWGLDDAINLELKPTPYFTETKELAVIYEERIIKKNWKSIWHKIKVHHIN
ncbi:hypothetical protein C2I06_12580 [Niallia circulans]|uniref:nucleotidyltransferase family protein n=1 Tax=Niallia circulans TaxID=1397 RepID=UPI000F457A07|nr:nucleotidyltransferase family protein [Niallia circulans]AYV67636.1 hypothetical protein C2I06_12580 [Niallia circulans]